MIVSRRDQDEINQLYNLYRGRLGGRKEDYFGLMYLLRKFKCAPEDVLEQVAVNSNQYGTNGYYVDASSRNLYLFQFSWTDNHNAFRGPMEALALFGIDRIFGEGLESASHDPLITRLRAELYEHKAAIDRIFIHFVFKGSADAADQSAGLQERRESLENKKYVIDSYFRERKVDLVVEYIADKRIVVPPPPASHTFDFEESVLIEAAGNRRLHVGFIRLAELVDMYEALGQRFLDRNIRAGLSGDRSPNKHIRAALEAIVLGGSQDPDVFVFNHNGVTLSAEEAAFSAGRVTLKVPRLLNGAQTITTVERFLSDNADSPKLDSGRSRFDKIRVLAKVVEYKPEGPADDFITTITVSNNRQNPVEPWNLRANDRIQCDLQDKMREDLGIFYSRQENAFSNLSDADLDEMKIADTRDMRIKPLAQTFLAAQGEIDKMSRLPEVFETQKTYVDTFRPTYLKADSRRIVVAYKVGLVLNSPIKRMVSDAPQWLQPAISRARNLVWALIVQGLFNDPRLDDQLDEFGASLAKESLFRDLTSVIAANKVLPILRSVLAEGFYRERIDEEKYTFLRTKELFKRCMEEGASRYGWTKQSVG